MTAIIQTRPGLPEVLQLQDLPKPFPADNEVLINGASGSVGTYAVQISKHFDGEVTAVCSTSNLDMVRSLGSDAVFDHTQEDFTLSGEKYAVIFDAVGKTTLKDCEPVLKADGVFVSVQNGLARKTTEGLNQLAQWAD
jgi:NADPH:quinone reductase-like Zn-dependent oxidoreductase